LALACSTIDMLAGLPLISGPACVVSAVPQLKTPAAPPQTANAIQNLRMKRLR
jgi:hypothetical protein